MVEVSRRSFGSLLATVLGTAAAGPEALSNASGAGYSVLQAGATIAMGETEAEAESPPKPCAYTLNRRAEQVAELHLEEKIFKRG